MVRVAKSIELFVEEQDAKDSRGSFSQRHEMDTPVRDLVDAGGDLEYIKSKICELTNELHPVFDERKKCACKHQRMVHCSEPTYAAALEVAPGLLEPLHLSWAPPSESLALRAVLQLAIRMITDKNTLPFRDGILAAAAAEKSSLTKVVCESLMRVGQAAPRIAIWMRFCKYVSD